MGSRSGWAALVGMQQRSVVKEEVRGEVRRQGPMLRELMCMGHREVRMPRVLAGEVSRRPLSATLRGLVSMALGIWVVSALGGESRRDSRVSVRGRV
jgi:hypothetical protein